MVYQSSCDPVPVYTDTSTGVVFIRPEEEELNKQPPRKAWDQAVPVGNLFGDRIFEGGVTRSISGESEDDNLATGALLIPVVEEVSTSETHLLNVCMYIVHCDQQFCAFCNHASSSAYTI